MNYIIYSELHCITLDMSLKSKACLAWQIKRDRITRLVVLPLYPQFSISTTGSSIRVLEHIFRYCLLALCECSWVIQGLFLINWYHLIVREDAYLSKLPVSIINSWYQREGYIKSMANLIQKELQSFSEPKEVGYSCVKCFQHDSYVNWRLCDVFYCSLKVYLVFSIC